jgi:pimeloyl-ACP methyl ester carboxylesterase
MIRKNFIYQGQPLQYRLAGSGQPLLLVHGFAEDSRVWENQLEALSKKYLLLLPDLPGCGASGMSGAAKNIPGTITMDSLAEILAALLDQEGITRAVMAGHSMGGYSCLAFAEKYPGRLLGLGLIHSTAYADSPEKITARQRGMEFIRSHGSAAFLQQSIPNLFSADFRKNHPERVQEMIDRYRDFDPEVLVTYYEAMIRRPDRTGVLRNFSGPLLFIIGKQDNAVPFEQSMKQCHLPQLSYIHLLEHSGHMGIWEEANQTNESLASFLDDVYV